MHDATFDSGHNVRILEEIRKFVNSALFCVILGYFVDKIEVFCLCKLLFMIQLTQRLT